VRYFENGPIIPTHLLEQQAQGNVIFFCGAGVSVPAGLDTFWTLTNRIITNLDAAAARAALAENQSFDRVFNLLVRDFGRPEIDRQIYTALGQQRPKTLARHRDILDLSRAPGGSVQVVTTNFDKLFERAAKGVQPIVPPGLPDIELNQPINGVVYLHGRLADTAVGDIASYVISSSDFGRAYLAEGWAARFVRALRERYTIVLLGYSADDPPMRYLLEGLHVRDGVVYDSPIYVFTDRSPSVAEELWQDRGVTPICYETDPKHIALWSTIGAWAKAARAPEQWTETVIELARKRPSNLSAHERGQVVQLVSSKPGARAFADAQPPINSEWLCVFDPYVRFGKPRRASWQDDAKEIDPKILFGLDDDPPRPTEGEKAFDTRVKNPLAWQKGDSVEPERISLPGWNALWHNPLPERLHHLARWFGGRCHEPAAVWWAAGWKSLNPHMHWFVAIRLRNRHGDPMPAAAQLFWSFYLEANEAAAAHDREYPWFEFEGLLKQSGWTPAVARYFERCVTPLVEVSRGTLAAPRPPEGDWDDKPLRRVIELTVRALDRHGHKVDLPPQALPQVVEIVRRSLIRISELLSETGDLFWHAPSLYPSGEPGETYHGKKEAFFLWFKELVEALLKQDASAARKEFEAWPADEARIFPKLRMWAAAMPSLVNAGQVFPVFQSLNTDAVWDAYNQRELLFFLKARWADLSARQRRAVERWLERGPSRWDDEKRSDFRKRRSAHAATRLRWLQLNGCALSSYAQQALDRLKAVDDRWSDQWAKDADDSLGPRGGWVQEVTELRGLDTVPLTDVVRVAEERSERPFRELKDYEPFKGLVESHPVRALFALRIAKRHGEFPIGFWHDLLYRWPDGTSLRSRRLLAHTVSTLSSEQALELRYYAPQWLEKRLPELYAHNRREALKVFDGFLAPYLLAEPQLTGSSIGTTSVGGVVQDRSEVSVSKALNSPIGTLTEALWSLTRRKAKKVHTPARALTLRFKRLVSVPGDGAGHAVAMLTRRLGWIAYCYEDWTTSFILPMFKPDQPLAEAAWHGLAANQNPLTAEILNQLKSSWIEMLKGSASWSLDPSEQKTFVQSLVWLSNPDQAEGAIFSFSEVRGVLAAIDDTSRGHALWALATAIEREGNWGSFGKPFIEKAWPRQLRFRSEEATRGFIQVAEKAGANFPDAVRTVLPYLRPVRNADMLTFRISKDRADADNIAREHPAAALMLVNAITSDDRTRMPYHLGEALEALAELDPPLKDGAEFRRLREIVG
jgi:hypothetical protein